MRCTSAIPCKAENFPLLSSFKNCSSPALCKRTSSMAAGNRLVGCRVVAIFLEEEGNLYRKGIIREPV